MTSISAKTPDNSPWFLARICNKGYIPLERASQEEQNDPNFSSVAPSSEVLQCGKEIRSKRLTIVHGFWPQS